MSPLLAKSNPEENLLDHTNNCLDVYDDLRNQMPFLDEVAKEPEFFNHLFYAVALHDFGKAATGFQRALTTGPRWNYRHEILSAGFADGLQLSQKAKQAIGLTILTHHKDIITLRHRYQHYPEGTDGFQIWIDRIAELEPNLEALMAIQKKLSCRSPAENCKWMPITSTDQLLNGYRDFLMPYRKAIRNGQLTTLHGRYGMLLRGCMIACDHLASAGRTKIYRALDDMEEHLRRHIEQKEQVFQGWAEFQDAASNTCGHLMLSAPTGSGKTEAAMLWSDANENESLGRRVFYVLPYTASINAMYKRLRNLVSEDLIGLLHGKANYFLYCSMVDGEYAPDRNYTPKDRKSVV